MDLYIPLDMVSDVKVWIWKPYACDWQEVETAALPRLLGQQIRVIYRDGLDLVGVYRGHCPGLKDDAGAARQVVQRG